MPPAAEPAAACTPDSTEDAAHHPPLCGRSKTLREPELRKDCDEPSAAGPRPPSRVMLGRARSSSMPEMSPPPALDSDGSSSDRDESSSVLVPSSGSTTPGKDDAGDDEDDEDDDLKNSPLAKALARKNGSARYLEPPPTRTMRLEDSPDCSSRSLDARSAASAECALPPKSPRGCLQKSGKVRKSASVQFGLDMGLPTKVHLFTEDATAAAARAERAERQRQEAEEGEAIAREIARAQLERQAPLGRLKAAVLGCFVTARRCLDDDDRLASDA